MRYLVKGDCSIPAADLSIERRAVRSRARRTSIRRVIGILCIALAGFFVIQLFRNAGPSDSASRIASPEWDNPSSVFSWIRWNFSNLGWQIRNEVKGTVPFGNLAVILKLACCAVAASVFLRGPKQL